MDAYLHRGYAESLSEFGLVRHLAHSGAWILDRPIPGTPHRDAMGCYPLLCCRDWRQLDRDLTQIGDRLVAVSAVTDPFGDYQVDDLRRSFADLVRPFKEHFATDLHRPVDDFVSAHHRRVARRALAHVGVEVCERPWVLLDDWVALYAELVARHRITGIPAFSRRAFARQLRVPGMVALRADYAGETVAMSLWFVQGAIAYYHLSASNAAGYARRAGFALMWYAIDVFADRGLRWLSLGAGAGAFSEDGDGLSSFKRGWSTETRTAYLCGRILDRPAYRALTRARGVHGSAYFPAYRAGEFAP